jgi:NADPH:quinone reductase-like Zn-dependent oxidoreductase
LIAVRAASVNYADCLIRRGLYSSAKEYVGWPITPGFDVAGEVLAVGPGVENIPIGARVMGVTRFGGYTSHINVPADQVFATPGTLTDAQAAAIPAVFLSAWYALYELARPKPGQRALVHSAAGGVGIALCQLLRAAGVEVTGVVGAPHKIDQALAAGAKHVIDRSKQSLWRRARKIAPEGFHMIFDPNGASTLRASYRHLAQPGKLVVYGFHTLIPKAGQRLGWLKLLWGYLQTPRFDPLDMTQRNRSVLAFNLSYLFGTRDNRGPAHPSILRTAMTDLLAGFASRSLTPPPVRTFRLEEAPEAQRLIESGQTVGKLVLIP